MNESEAHKLVEEHLDRCWEWMADAEDWSEERGDEDKVDTFEPYGPFCGCSTCVVREVLLVALDNVPNIQWLPDESRVVVPLLPVPDPDGSPAGWCEGSDRGAQDGAQVSTDRQAEGGVVEGRTAKYRISIQRGVGMTSVSIQAPEGCLTNACDAAKDLLEKMPESTFQGEGLSISTIPGFGPRTFPDGEAA